MTALIELSIVFLITCILSITGANYSNGYPPGSSDPLVETVKSVFHRLCAGTSLPIALRSGPE